MDLGSYPGIWISDIILPLPDIRGLCRLTCYSNVTCRAVGYGRATLQERSVCEFGLIQDKKVQVETKLPQSQYRPQ